MRMNDDFYRTGAGDDNPLDQAAGIRRWRQVVRNAPDLRMERVIRVRSQIDDGSYDEQAGFDTMIDRMSTDLAGLGLR